LEPEVKTTDEALGHVCPPSVVRWLNSPLRRLIQNPRKIFAGYVRPGDTAIDLGCGGGFFSVALAGMVGENGRVIAADMQEEMLRITRNLATKKGVLDRIILHQCRPDDIDLSGEKADFVLAFYVVHEVSDRVAFLSQAAGLLKPNARFMMIEPKHHVKKSQLKQILSEAELAGLKPIKSLKLFASRGMLFRLKTADNL